MPQADALPEPVVPTQTRPASDQDELDDGELALPYWLTSTEEAANTTFLTMLKRLPRLLREAWLLAWQASRRTTVAVVVFQILGGAASAVGMISVVGVFNGLLQEGPTPRPSPSPLLQPGPDRTRTSSTTGNWRCHIG